MKFAELIEHCIQCIKSFNPIIKTLDSHADDYIAQVTFFYCFNLLSLKTHTSEYSLSKSSTE